MSENDVLLHVKEITGGYDKRVDIIHDVSLKVRQGEICSIIGPNGAGKSTLFRFIYGFLKPKSGKIFFAGDEITEISPPNRLTRGICYVPQGRSNFPLLTVRENLKMGAFTRKDDNVRRDIEKLMNRFPTLREKQDVLAGNLSGGQQQILEMAMALMLKPRLLLLDEPSLGLAPLIVRTVFEQVQRINSEGTTVIMVEQNARRALSISDHAIVLALGRKRYEGTGLEMLESVEVKRLYLGG